ncbi:hypothetical protein E6H16_01340 [Candidatus Bathyarchaeota archaeon]|nr:MAG: hypothetical protein E6H16_01340 [Candidatus Bathyarchaeota archaeon]
MSYATSILIFLTLANSMYLNVKPVSGTTPTDLPTLNTWAPYGPMVKNLQLHYYASDTAEFNGFLAGNLDLTDWPLPAADYASVESNPDFQLSPLQGGFTIFGIYFNGASSRFTASKESPTSPANGPYWGCDWNMGTQFTLTEQTYVSKCGINMRQAFAHLIDRPRFAQNNRGRLGEALLPISDPSPLTLDPSGSNVTVQCSWDPLYPSALYPTCLGAYNFGDDPSGFPAKGSIDFCAAADHMITAGIATGKQAGTCVLTGVNPGVFAHPLRFVIRNLQPRLNLANGFINALNQLFGGQAANPSCFQIFCFYPVVFSDPPVSPIDDWDAFTYGYSLAGAYPVDLYTLYYSPFATNYCGGIQNGFPSNPSFVCNPTLDQHLKIVAQTIDVPTLRKEALAAFKVFGANAIDIPVYTEGVRTPALTSVAGLVNQLGVGYPNFYTLLNAHQNSGYTPSNPIYTFGGGDPTTLRYGQASPTTYLNIFNAQTAWEFNVLGEVYDTLFFSSPVQPGNVFCWMCNTFTQSIDSKGNEHFLVELRQNLRWQDGAVVDAKDVAFSLLSLRDLAYTAGYNLVGKLQSVNVLSNTTLDIVFNGQSINYPVFLEAFIIPRHLWECDLVAENDCAAGAAAVIAAGGKVSDYTNAGVNVPSSSRTDPSYDPLTSGTLIGSGPFLCRSIFPEDLGRIGTGCAKNNDGTRSSQSLGVDATITLQAYDRTGEPGNTDPFLQYMRSYNPAWATGTGTSAFSGQYQEFVWADQNKDAQVTISELASVGSCFNASGPTSSCSNTAYNYWLRSAFHPHSPTTISSEVAIVASHLDDTYIYPYSWNPPNLDQIIPYG